MKLALCLLLTACASEPYVVPPQLDQVTVHVYWLTEGQIQARMPGTMAFATHGTKDMPVTAIWAIRPDGFDDAPRVCALGHEMLHVLGARH